MSTLTVTNLDDGATSVPTTYITAGSAKVNFLYDNNTSFTVRNSLNVSSITDVAVARAAPQFTNNMADAVYISATDYCYRDGVETTTGNSGSLHVTSRTTSSCATFTSDGGLNDCDENTGCLMGDLA